MEALSVIAGLVVLFLVWEYRKAGRRLRAGAGRLDEAWREAKAAFMERVEALRDFARALEREGLVPAGRRAIEELLAEAGKGELDVEAIHLLDERMRAVLWRVFAALPRERPRRLRDAQNRLAEAAEEYDIKRRRYNELVGDWNALLLRFPYRFIAARRGYAPRDPLPVRSEWESP